MPYATPTFNVLANVWLQSSYQTRPSGPPQIGLIRCSSRPVRSRDGFFWNQISYASGVLLIAFPSATVIPDLVGQGADQIYRNLSSQIGVIEMPANSGMFYIALLTRTVARGFPNEYVQVIAMRQNGAGPGV